MTAVATGSTTTAALDSIFVDDDNVRDKLDDEHVNALAKSIELQGILVPLVVQAAVEPPHTYQLVAGFHRYAAARQLGLQEAPIVLRGEGDDMAISVAADRATENILRKQLNPYEEAKAVEAMLARGLSKAGAADALGWSVQRVDARMKMLELPEKAQQMIGKGDLALSAVGDLEIIGDVSPAIQELVVDYMASPDTSSWVADEFQRSPVQVIHRAVQDMGQPSKHWIAGLSSFGADDVESFKLGKTATHDMAEAEKHYKELNPHHYGGASIKFSDAEIDQARAAGVLIELGSGVPLITDRKLVRELMKQAIKREVPAMRERAEASKKAAAEARKKDPNAPADPLADAKREHKARLRELGDEAHGANLELGASLINGLSSVDVDMDVARFFAYGLLGPDHKHSTYNQDVGDRVRKLAADGIRIVLDEFREDVTKVKKDGTRGRLKIDYGARSVQQDPVEPQKWLWKFVDGAKTPPELFGRVLVVIAAERYALARVVLPGSQNTWEQHYGSHKDIAEKMLKKLTGGHVPASVTRIKRAIDKAHGDLHRVEEEARKADHAKRFGAESVHSTESEVQDSVENQVENDAGLDGDDLVVEADDV